MNIQGGGLSFEISGTNDKLMAVLEQSRRAIQNFSTAAVAGGKGVDAAFKDAAAAIEKGFENIYKVLETNEAALSKLQQQYKQLSSEAAKAFSEARDADYRRHSQAANNVKAEIALRKKLIAEATASADELVKEEQELKKRVAEVEKNSRAQQSLETQLRKCREALVAMRDAGQSNTTEYRAMQEEAGRLAKAWKDATDQSNILAHDQRGMQGLISGLSGLSGGFAAVQGAIGLFTGENENLQKVMLKVQSIMSVTMGLQEIQKALDKDSAFRLVTLNGLKEWWNKLLVAGRGQQVASTAATVADTAATVANTAATTADTVATQANTAAQAANTAAQTGNTVSQGANAVATGAQAAAATAGTVANIGLAGAFRMVGAAIKSIPVIGWVLAGVSALIGIVSHFVSKANEAKKAQEKWYDSIAENAYKPIAGIEDLSVKWNALGDDLEAKKKFIEQNAQAFDELGVSVNGVNDAENLLVNNKQAFINAQIEKAKSIVLLQQAQDKVKDLLKKEQEYNAMPDKAIQYIQTSSFGTGYYIETENKAKQRKEEEIKALRATIEREFADAAAAESAGFKILKDAGIEGAKSYADGTLGAIEQAIQRKQDLLKKAANNTEYDKIMQEIKGLQKQADSIKGNSGGKTGKDPYSDMLNKRKEQYSQYAKMITSKDAEVRQAAQKEFAALLAEGTSYIDFLENKRAEINAKADKTAADIKNLGALNREIADASDESIISDFEKQLDRELAACQTIGARLDLLEQRRQALSGDNSDVDNAKGDIINTAKSNTINQAREETKQLLKEHAAYLSEKIEFEESYARKRELLEKALSDATSQAERERTQYALDSLEEQRRMYEKSSGNEQYDALLGKYKSFEQQRLEITAKYAKLRVKAQQDGNKQMEANINKEEARELLKNAFDGLKASPDYIRAFDDLKGVTTATLESLLQRFDEVKEQAAATLSPEDLREYMNTLQGLMDELNSRDPFTALKNSYKELKAAEDEVAAAEKNLATVRNSGQSATKEAAAIARLNAAKDKQFAASQKTRKAEKEVSDVVTELAGNIAELGDTIGGEAGEILSLIGDIGTFFVSSMDAVKNASQQGSNAIKAVEKASVILAIVSAAYQIATKIISFFAGNDGVKEYEKTREVYQNYLNVLDDVIDKQLELITTLNSRGAKEASDYAIGLLEKEGKAARQLGKDYLNAGASRGFLGMGSKASHGKKQRKNITGEAWAEYWTAASASGISQYQAQRAVEGRMTGMFDFTADQLRKLRDNAALFWAQLDDDTREYLDKIIEADEKIKEAVEKLKEGYTGVSFESINDDFLNMMYEWDVTAERISRNIGDYMRKALINEAFKLEYSDRLRYWYDQWAESMSDGKLTENEQSYLDQLRDNLAAEMEAKMSAINKQFKWVNEEESDPSTLSGAIKGASQESIDLLAGQTNAVRVNQVTSLALMREQLLYLSNIDRGVNVVIPKQLQTIINKLPASGGGELRSQGLV